MSRKKDVIPKKVPCYRVTNEGELYIMGKFHDRYESPEKAMEAAQAHYESLEDPAKYFASLVRFRNN